MGTGFAHHPPAKSKLGQRGVDTARGLKIKHTYDRKTPRKETRDRQYTRFMQLNKSILVQARDQPPTQQAPPQSLFPVPEGSSHAGSAPKAGANPGVRETNTVTGAKHRDFNQNHTVGGAASAIGAAMCVRSRAPGTSDGHWWQSEEGKQLIATPQGHIPSSTIRLRQELAALSPKTPKQDPCADSGKQEPQSSM